MSGEGLRRTSLEKNVDGTMLSATVEECGDGSALAVYDGFALVVEFDDDAFNVALQHVIDAGYRAVEE